MSRAQRPGSAPRWPDLLIGLLVVLLLAGFAALLIGQGREAPTAVAPPPPVVEEVPEIPVAPGTDLGVDPVEEPTPAPEASAAPEETEPTAEPEATTPREETPPAQAEPEAAAPTPTPSEPAEPPAEQAAQPSTPAPEASTAKPPAASADPSVVAATPIPAAPPAPPVPEVTLPKPKTTIPLNRPAGNAATPPASEGARPDAPEGTEAGETAEATPPATPAPSGNTVAPSEERTPLRSDYRISLGTFGSEAEARRAASGVSDAGYPVYVIDLGNQVVAQVGPYADETTARRALADIQPRAPRAVLYAPRGRNLTGGGSETTEAAAPAETPAPAAPPEAVPDEPEAAPAAQAPAPDGPVYLQVGAFDRQESAGRLVGMLRDLGFSPTVNAPENRKVTVLVGPYSGDALLEAERKLDANGHDHFRIR
ncbi:SPOR domain-containing protein [Deinococcus sp. NW-56]|uniref:SPOR domain-containing protein n=1 Tax=Deinococcus sp. NW-56 TaxID=2080419 RepID=UPI000CF3C196|nr:SPOR domain-containing protein [Deinococcus sp. NW-56]